MTDELPPQGSTADIIRGLRAQRPTFADQGGKGSGGVPSWLEDLRRVQAPVAQTEAANPAKPSKAPLAESPAEAAVPNNGKQAAEPQQYPLPPNYFDKTVVHTPPLAATPHETPGGDDLADLFAKAAQPAAPPAEFAPLKQEGPPDWLNKLPPAAQPAAPPAAVPPDWLDQLPAAAEAAVSPAESAQPPNLQAGFEKKDLSLPLPPRAELAVVNTVGGQGQVTTEKPGWMSDEEWKAQQPSGLQTSPVTVSISDTKADKHLTRSQIRRQAKKARRKAAAALAQSTALAPTAEPEAIIDGRQAAQAVADTWTGMVSSKPPVLTPTESTSTELAWPESVAKPDLRPVAELETMQAVLPQAVSEPAQTPQTPDQQFISGLIKVGITKEEAANVRRDLGKLPPSDRGRHLKLVLDSVIHDEDPEKRELLKGEKAAELLLALQLPSVEKNPVTEADRIQNEKDRIISLMASRRLSFMRGEDSIKSPDGKPIRAQEIEQLLGVGEDGKVTPDGLVADLVHIVDAESDGLSDLVGRCQSVVDKEGEHTEQIKVRRDELVSKVTDGQLAKIEEVEKELDQAGTLVVELGDSLDEATQSLKLAGISHREQVLGEAIEGERQLALNEELEERFALASRLKTRRDLMNSNIVASVKKNVGLKILSLTAKLNRELFQLRESLGMSPRNIAEFKSSEGYKRQTDQVAWIRRELGKWVRLTNPEERNKMIEQIAGQEINYERVIDSRRAEIPTDIKKGDSRSPKYKTKVGKEAEIEEIIKNRDTHLAQLRGELIPATEGLDKLRTSMVGRIYADMVKGALYTVSEKGRVQSVKREGLQGLVNLSGLEGEIQARIAELKASKT